MPQPRRRSRPVRLPALAYGWTYQHETFAIVREEQARSEADEIDAILGCAAVGELRELAPHLRHGRLDGQVVEEDFEDEPDDKPLTLDGVPGAADGDWPGMPDQNALDWLPDEVFAELAERAGAEERETVLNGPYLYLDPDREEALVEVLSRYAESVRRDDDLIERFLP